MIKKASSTFLLLFFFQVNAALSSSLTETAITVVEASKDSQVISGDEGWLFLKEELQHIAAGEFWGDNAAQASRTTKKEFSDPFPAITDYNKALADKGISLYLMIVPPKALIYAHKLDPALTDTTDEIRTYQEFYKQLETAGVKVIDLLPELQSRAKQHDNLYCRTDTHYSPEGLYLFAREAARKIKQYDWYDDYDKRELVRTEQPINMRGDLSQMAGGNDTESITLQLITDKATGSFLESDEGSPVLLLGDSHTLVFNSGGDLHAKGAGLFDNLSAELGFAVDLLGVRGSGANPARIRLYQRAKKNAAYLSGKKVVIWCFAARELTGTGGWRTIPIAP